MTTDRNRPLRVLGYNWVDYRDPEGRGGGVSVYQRNVMAALDARDGVEAGFFCSGLSHDLRGGAPRWEAMRHGPNRGRPRHWEIVNAHPLSPAHHAFGDPAQLAHPATEDAVCDLVAATGPWDALHFNNLEGLPVGVLARLRQRFPTMRLVVSLHNYYPLCPQVNLWRQERATCTDFEAGRACVDCLPHRPDRRMLRLADALAYRLKRAGIAPGSWAFDTAFRWSLRAGRRAVRLAQALRSSCASGTDRLPATDEQHYFGARRPAMIAAINAQCSAVLCVSDAVQRIAVAHGIDPALTHTLRIGTAEAEAWSRTTPRPLPAPDGTLHLGYLGYMRRDKGFYFLLDALETAPAALAARLHLVVAARRADAGTMDRLLALRGRLASVTHRDGYNHADLDMLAARIDVGLVPVLWHDNLPQVAIELHARHVPLLCADMGGASELAAFPAMTFPAGDAAAFHQRLAALCDGRVNLRAYWHGALSPTRMADHVDALLGVYERRSQT